MITVPKRYRQTDRQTDGRHAISSPRSALASRGKNRIRYRYLIFQIVNSSFSVLPDSVIELIVATATMRHAGESATVPDVQSFIKS